MRPQYLLSRCLLCFMEWVRPVYASKHEPYRIIMNVYPERGTTRLATSVSNTLCAHAWANELAWPMNLTPNAHSSHALLARLASLVDDAPRSVSAFPIQE